MRPRIIRFGDFEFDFETQELREAGVLVELSNYAIKALELLLEEPGRIYTHDEIRERLWPDGRTVDWQNAIRKCLFELRGKLDDRPVRGQRARYIETEWARGYRFKPDSIATDDEPPAPEYTADVEDEVAGAQLTCETIAIPRPFGAGLLTWVRYASIGAVFIALVLALFKTLMAASYGLAIATMVVAALLAATFSNPRASLRTCLALLTISIMGFIASASTMPFVLTHVVNAGTLPPAVVYPAVTGLKFIPLPVLVLGFWVLFFFFGDRGFLEHRSLRLLYLVLGPAFVIATVFSLIQASADYQIFSAQIPGSWKLLAGYAFVLAANLLIWGWAYRFFNQEIVSTMRIFLLCGAGYLPIAFGAYFVDQQYNLINASHLDMRRPIAYRAENPEAIKHLENLSPETRQKIGATFSSLLSDPQFENVLQHQVFYRQNYDEAFQLNDQAVMFGYRKDASGFEIIRFPKELADALRFEPVSQVL